MNAASNSPAPTLRVLQLGPFPPPHGGVEINLVAIRDFLRRKQIPCGVINLTRHRRIDADDVFYPQSSLQVLSLLLRSRARILHLHIGGDVSWRLLLLGLVCSLLPGKKTVLTLHSGGYPSSPAGRAARPMSFRGFLFRRFDGLIGVNQEIVEMFVRFGVPKTKTKLILPFAITSAPSDVQLPQAVETFLQKHDPLLLTVSGLESEYDIPLQIEALGVVIRHVPNCGLVICGGGSLAQNLRDDIRNRSFAAQVLLTGDLPHEVVLKLIARATLFLRTTKYDGDSIAVREALHFGVRTIVTDTGMRPAGVHLIPIGSKSALVQKVLELLRLNVEQPLVINEKSTAQEDNVAAVLRFYSELAENLPASNKEEPSLMDSTALGQ